MYWQRPHMEGSQFEFIPQGSECNGDVTRRRHGAADRGGTVRGNAIHTTVPGGTGSYGGMIGSYWKLHFGEQHDGKKGYGFKE